MLDIVGGTNGRARIPQIKSHVLIRRERAAKVRRALSEIAAKLPAGSDRARLEAAAGLIEIALDA